MKEGTLPHIREKQPLSVKSSHNLLGLQHCTSPGLLGRENSQAAGVG
jgi:hypothetical protein